MCSTQDTLKSIIISSIEPVNNVYIRSAQTIPDRFSTTSAPLKYSILPEELNSITKINICKISHQ